MSLFRVWNFPCLLSCSLFPAAELPIEPIISTCKASERTVINMNASSPGISPHGSDEPQRLYRTCVLRYKSTRHEHRCTCRTFFHTLTRLWRCASSGQAALRPFSNGGAAATTLAKLHSGLLSQFLNLFVPYVKRLTEAVKTRGVRRYAMLKLASKQ